MSNNEFSMIASYSQVIAKALDSKGVAYHQLFKKAQVPLLDDNNPEKRISYVKIAELFKLAVEATNDPYFGLYASKYMLPNHIHALGASLLASKNLFSFLQHFEKYNRFIADTVDFKVHIVANKVIFRCNLIVPICNETQDTFWSFILRFMRHLNTKTFNPVEVKLARPKPETGGKPYEDFYSCPVTFNHSCIEYSFNHNSLLSPLFTASAELVNMNDKIMDDFLLNKQWLSFSALVEKLVNDGLRNNAFDKKSVAKKLNMSPRTMQLKLTHEATTFMRIQDKCRFELAKRYLQQRKSFNEISFLLGFSETSSFSRTFKRWSGKSPSQFV